jgi:hypothetical protein
MARTSIPDFPGEAAGPAIDWIVLSLALLATSLSLVSTAQGGAAPDARVAASACEGGLDAVRRAEAARVAAGAPDGLDVAAWRADNLRGLGDVALRHELAVMRAGLGAAASAEATMVAVMECEAVLRGLG